MPTRLRTIALTLVLGCSLNGAESVSGQETIEAYAFLVGSWEGELEYLDYGDNSTRVRLPTTLTCERSADATALELQFAYTEPSGRLETSTERLLATADGVYLGDFWRIREPAREVSPGVFRLVLERDGDDNGQAAVLVNSINLDGDELRITSTVTYRDSGESLQRHQYRLLRATNPPVRSAFQRITVATMR